MKVPASQRRRALAIIDVQAEFVTEADDCLLNIERLAAAVSYDLYIESVFTGGPTSLWQLQTGWSLPEGSHSQVLPAVTRWLTGKCVVSVRKTTKSIFKGDQSLLDILRAHRIEELHLTGFDINDCVMASAFDAFDNGLVTYVIEECCGPSSGTDLALPAVKVLRYLNLTNNSVYESLPMVSI